MNKNIDLTKILKNCPNGFELYSTLCGTVLFRGIDCDDYPVKCEWHDGKLIRLTKEGYFFNYNGAECLLFPSKDQRDWSKFTAPWVKKESENEKIKNAILNHLEMWGNCQDNVCGVHIEDAIDWLEKQGEQKPCMVQWKGDNLKEVIRFTGKDKNFEKWFKSFEEYEKYVHEHNDIFKLFNENGNHYEIPVGAWIVKTPDGYNIASNAVLKQKQTDEIEPKFKVGDRIRHKETNKDDVYEISKVYDDSYGIVGFTWMIYMKYQDQYELAPNKFDPKTLKPFDKVITKFSDYPWKCDIFSYYRGRENKIIACYCTSEDYVYDRCIPYNDETKHLVGTTEEAPEYYRYWED